jgi:hypothetical protein
MPLGGLRRKTDPAPNDMTREFTDRGGPPECGQSLVAMKACSISASNLFPTPKQLRQVQGG